MNQLKRLFNNNYDSFVVIEMNNEFYFSPKKSFYQLTITNEKIELNFSDLYKITDSCCSYYSFQSISIDENTKFYFDEEPRAMKEFLKKIGKSTYISLSFSNDEKYLILKPISEIKKTKKIAIVLNPSTMNELYNYQVESKYLDDITLVKTYSIPDYFYSKIRIIEHYDYEGNLEEKTLQKGLVEIKNYFKPENTEEFFSKIYNIYKLFRNLKINELIPLISDNKYKQDIIDLVLGN